MQTKKKVYTTAIMAFLMFSIVLASMPMAKAAEALTLTPTTQTPGASVTVDGTGFGATTAVGIGFGAEVNVINEVMNVTGPFDVGIGPYIGYLSHPIKPGTFRMSVNTSSTAWWEVSVDAGNGTLITPLPGNNTIDYVTGKFTRFTTGPVPSSLHNVHLCNYTTYEYDVTPAAGVTTFATGTFQAAITVPSAFNGNHQVTAIDTQGHIATALLTVTGGASVWDKTYGGAGSDIGTGWTVQTSDGGYAIEGDTESFGMGGSDAWLIKTDADGNVQWNKTYGGALNEVSGDMCQTSDGGYAIAGGTYSFGAGSEDFWLVKTDADGMAYWAKTYGGTGNEIAYHVVQTSDGGYAMAGSTTSFGAGSEDAWLVKTDASGNMQWNKTYGGNSSDYVVDVIKTSDGGYAIEGMTRSFGAGGMDAWLVKTDAAGTMLWNKTYGGTGTDMGESIVQTSDGGYAWVGYTTSFGAGGMDCWFVKTDAAGNMQWNKTYGTTGAELAIHMIQTADEGYAMVGWNYVNGQDFLLIKTDAAGNLQWNLTYGGTGVENAYALLQASDGGYVMTGNTNSFGAGGNDIWLVKTNALGVVPEGLTIGVMLLLTTVAVIVGTRYFRKQPKL